MARCSKVSAASRSRRRPSTGGLAMSRLRLVLAWLSRWIDDAALGFLRVTEALSRGRRLELIEGPDGGFQPTRKDNRSGVTEIGPRLRLEGGEFLGPIPTETRSLLSGSRVEIVLVPSRFIFRQLELPVRAADFLEGVLREQIDRLTPWRSSDAAFGWGAPDNLDEKRIAVTVAATRRASLAPIAEALARCGVESLTVSTAAEPSDGAGARIKVLSQRGGEELRLQRLRRMLIGGLALACVTSAAAAAAAIFVGGALEVQEEALRQDIATRRAALVGGRGSEAEQALAALDEKKHATPPDVIVIETLSKTLPDTAYLTGLRIEDNKLQIDGLAGDAPGLIQLMEQSRYFTHARFTAPTTNAPGDHGERFHIEAHAEPIFKDSQ
jgi:general secretion pathway protein L